jgi:hypothetical protein
MAAKPNRGGTLIVPTLKPRVKKLNEALVSLGGGPMKNPRNWDRVRQKRELRALLKEDDERNL